jgi:hypothetical protein
MTRITLRDNGYWTTWVILPGGWTIRLYLN